MRSQSRAMNTDYDVVIMHPAFVVFSIQLIETGRRARAARIRMLREIAERQARGER